MTDTDIKALVERLRLPFGYQSSLDTKQMLREAADALEALQECASNAVRAEAELAAKAEAERDEIRDELTKAFRLIEAGHVVKRFAEGIKP